MTKVRITESSFFFCGCILRPPAKKVLWKRASFGGSCTHVPLMALFVLRTIAFVFEVAEAMRSCQIESHARRPVDRRQFTVVVGCVKVVLFVTTLYTNPCTSSLITIQDKVIDKY